MMKFTRAHVAPMYVKLLIHGLSGAGKSHIGATAGDPSKDGSDVAILLFEPNGLPTIAQVNPNAILAKAYAPDEHGVKTAYEVMLGFVQAASSGTFQAAGVTTLVVDSATEAMRAIRDEIVRQRVGSTGKTPEEFERLCAGYQLTMPDWGELGERTLRMIRTFRDLPFDLVMLALSEKGEDDQQVTFTPQFDGKKVPGSIMGFFSAVGYAFKREVVVQIDGRESKRVEHYVMFEGPTRFSVKPSRPLSNIELMEDRRSGDWLKRIRAYQHPIVTASAPIAPATTPETAPATPAPATPAPASDPVQTETTGTTPATSPSVTTPSPTETSAPPSEPSETQPATTSTRRRRG